MATAEAVAAADAAGEWTVLAAKLLSNADLEVAVSGEVILAAVAGDLHRAVALVDLHSRTRRGEILAEELVPGQANAEHGRQH